MKKSVQIIACMAAFFAIVFPVDAQTPYWEFKINAGYNIGGTSPIPLPAEIRKIEKYTPVEFPPHVALEASRWFNERWGLTAQLTLDLKGFTVKDSVLNLWTEMEMKEGYYAGTFTGHNETNIKNTYLTIPVMASYRLSDVWLLQAGIYAAWMYAADFKGTASNGYIRDGGPTGEKTLVDVARFDFSEKQRSLDCGLLAAAEWKFTRNFALRGQLAWGLIPVFPSSFTGMPFKMYNIYGTLGVSYLLKQI
jgi:hypothetical protein